MLDTLFCSAGRVKLLKILLLESPGNFYLRELAARAGMSVGTVSRELLTLTESGIVTKEARGRQTYFSINERCPIVPELRSMFVKTMGVADVIRASLVDLPKGIQVAFIYGSLAKGSQTAESDIDLMVIGDVSFREIIGAVREAQDQIGREINPTVYPADEFAERVRGKDHFITSVMDEPKVFVIGDEDELRKLA